MTAQRELHERDREGAPRGLPGAADDADRHDGVVRVREHAAAGAARARRAARRRCCRATTPADAPGSRAADRADRHARRSRRRSRRRRRPRRSRRRRSISRTAPAPPTCTGRGPSRRGRVAAACVAGIAIAMQSLVVGVVVRDDAQPRSTRRSREARRQAGRHRGDDGHRRRRSRRSEPQVSRSRRSDADARRSRRRRRDRTPVDRETCRSTPVDAAPTRAASQAATRSLTRTVTASTAIASAARPPRRADLTRDAVAAKFTAVKREYDTYKAKNGGRLDGEWDDLATFMQYQLAPTSSTRRRASHRRVPMRKMRE